MKRDGTPTKREVELGLARMYAFHEDTEGYIRLLVEHKHTSWAALEGARAEGARARLNGGRCSCADCAGLFSKEETR